ncbi:MAG: sugar transferase [Candidatus Omnitrophota bacterium]|nr:sugar transferase [Candidatus Omnitrophota bacterium]
MGKRFRHSFIKSVYILIDVILTSLAIYFACSWREIKLPFDVTLFNLFFDPTNPYRFVFLFWITITIILNNNYGLYQTNREVYETTEVSKVINAVVMSALLTIVALYLGHFKNFPRTVIFITTILMAASFSLWRIMKRAFVSYLVSRGYNNFNAIIIGAGKIGNALAQEIEKKPELGIKIVGFLDDFKSESKSGQPILGKISGFATIAPREFVNKVFITIHHDSQVFFKLLEQAKELGIAVRVVPQGFELMPGEFCKFNIGFIPILEYCNEASLRRQTGKRIFDIFISLIATILLFPLFIALAILIKLDSPGPVFYLSKRYGRRGRIFKMYKFRSMVKEADEALKHLKDKNEVDGPIFKIKKDPRVTQFGKILRRYSLDELPQFINVLKGEMSLVGPRPLPIEQIEKEDLRQLKRLEVRPGITGLWQIRGRSEISFSRLVKWDAWYINNWSFWLDFNILLQTIPVVFKAKGAY